MTIDHVDYAVLNSDPVVKASVETRCRQIIAAAANIPRANVHDVLLVGNRFGNATRLSYAIAVPPANMSAVKRDLWVGIHGSLANDILDGFTTLLASIHTTGVAMSVTNVEQPEEETLPVKEASSRTVLVQPMANPSDDTWDYLNVSRIEFTKDCLLSEWLDWGPCFNEWDDLKARVQMRKRVIVNPHLTGGRECPPFDANFEQRTCRDAGPWGDYMASNQTGNRRQHHDRHDNWYDEWHSQWYDG